PAPAAPAATAPAATAPATTTPAAAAAAASKYVVEKGDSLWKIAAEKYGDGALWSRIAKANTLKHPNHIEIGEELELPAQ
ncbi:5'-nucleotidase, partial [Agrobacterium tumefaciens str. Cherry 2E-2-2]